MSARALPAVREMIATLVAEPSPSSADPRFDRGNRRVVEHLADWADGLGMRVELLPSATNDDKANLLATFGEGDGGLVLAGHSDTVPWDEGRWRHDPFRVTEDDGRLYGLGTSDMKSFFAVALAALARLDAGKLRAPVMLLATYDEESTMGGARALVAAGRPRARHALIGEPTGLVPVRMHKGAVMETVVLTGQAGHSSDPSLGRSALEGMHAVIGDLIAFREALQAVHRNEAFAVPVPTMNFGAIHGGDSPNRICGECELRFDLRALPGMDVQALRTELRARVGRNAKAAKNSTGWCPPWSFLVNSSRWKAHRKSGACSTAGLPANASPWAFATTKSNWRARISACRRSRRQRSTCCPSLTASTPPSSPRYAPSHKGLSSRCPPSFCSTPEPRCCRSRTCAGVRMQPMTTLTVVQAWSCCRRPHATADLFRLRTGIGRLTAPRRPWS